MIRRAFLRRMMGAALASGLLGAELLTRRGESGGPRWQPEGARITYQGRDIGGVALADVVTMADALSGHGFPGPYELHVHPETWRALMGRAS